MLFPDVLTWIPDTYFCQKDGFHAESTNNKFNNLRRVVYRAGPLSTPLSDSQDVTHNNLDSDTPKIDTPTQSEHCKLVTLHTGLFCKGKGKAVPMFN